MCVCKANLHTILLQFMHLLSFCFMNKALFSVWMNECVCVTEKSWMSLVAAVYFIFTFHYITTSTICYCNIWVLKGELFKLH